MRRRRSHTHANISQDKVEQVFIYPKQLLACEVDTISEEKKFKSNDLCHTLSSALEVSRATIKDFLKFLRAED